MQVTIARLQIFLLLTLPAQLCFSQESPDTGKLRNIIDKYGQAEVVMPVPGSSGLDRLTRNASIRYIRDKIVSVSLSPKTVDWFIASGYDYSVVEPSEHKGVSTAKSMKEAMDWESYPTYTQYDSIMRYFASEYPSLCKLDTIGTSVKGKLVLVLKISDNCSKDEAEPEVFYTSTMHGDETGGFLLMLRLAEYLLKNYNSDRSIKELVDNLEIWINPLANPDGTYRPDNTISSPTRNNANGYDLNRNFPDSETPNTVRQKETIDMMRFMAERKFVLSANFHSGSEVVNHPWDKWERDHADNDWFYGISRAYADEVHLYAPGGYMTFLDNGVTKGYDWYIVYGGRQDYMTYTLHGREITVEVDNDYVTPASELPGLWEYNRRSLIHYLANALAGIHGSVKDALTGRPVAAKAFIYGHDEDNSHVFSDTLTGDFYRFIEPGIWNITFTADGYTDTLISNVNVVAGERTDLTVEMVPVLNPGDTSKTLVPLLYPNPATTFIKAVMPEKIRGNINIRLFNQTGIKLKDYDTEATEVSPVYIDVSQLVSGVYTMVFTKTSNGASFTSRIIVVR